LCDAFAGQRFAFRAAVTAESNEHGAAGVEQRLEFAGKQGFDTLFPGGVKHAAFVELANFSEQTWQVVAVAVSGASALIYLGRYLYRGVIREQDIVACRDGQVTFRYRNAKTGRMEQRTVSGADFLWLVLQHVLPKGFRRARNFGFLHPNCKRLIALLHLLLKFVPPRAADWVLARAPIVCTCCGAVMKIVRTRIPPTLVRAAPDPLAVRGAR